MNFDLATMLMGLGGGALLFRLGEAFLRKVDEYFEQKHFYEKGSDVISGAIPGDKLEDELGDMLMDFGKELEKKGNAEEAAKEVKKKK